MGGELAPEKRDPLNETGLRRRDVSVNQGQERFGADVEELPPTPPPHLPPHHVQAATVHQRSELMQADLCGVQDPLDLLQTSLERTNNEKNQTGFKTQTY